MKVGLIYKVTNKINGKIYIGQTLKWSRRKSRHLYDAFDKNSRSYNTYFCRAIRKYGKENFVWEVIYKNISGNMLDVAEMCAVYTFDSLEKGYNSTTGGEGCYGYQCSLETRQKLREINIGKHHTEETKRKLSILNKGKKMSEESKKKISKFRTGRKQTESAKLKVAIIRGAKLFDVFEKTTNKYVGTWLNQSECARLLICQPGNINNCLHKRLNSHRGYIFKYRQKSEQL